MLRRLSKPSTKQEHDMTGTARSVRRKRILLWHAPRGKIPQKSSFAGNWAP